MKRRNGPEAGALGEGARDERRGDDGEHHLEGHEEQVGHAVGAGVDAHALEAKVVEIPDQAKTLVGAKGERVADHRPEHAHDPDRDE